MSGSKTVINKSSLPLRVTLVGRQGDTPNLSASNQGTAYIEAGKQAVISYGSDRNPYLNEIHLQFSDESSTIEQSLLVSQRGNVGTLDNKFNANSVFELNYNPSANSFSLAAHE